MEIKSKPSEIGERGVVPFTFKSTSVCCVACSSSIPSTYQLAELHPNEFMGAKRCFCCARKYPLRFTSQILSQGESRTLCQWCVARTKMASPPCTRGSASGYYERMRLMTVEKNPGPAQGTTEMRDVGAVSADIVGVLVEWLELFGFKSSGFRRHGDIVQWSEWIKDAGDWMKVVKFKLAAFYQFAQLEFLVDKQLPPSPFKETHSHPLHLLGGRAGRFIRRQLAIKTKRQEFLSSLLLVKTGMPRPNLSEMIMSQLKTEVTLTMPRDTRGRQQPVLVEGLKDHQRLNGIMSPFELEEQVRRTAREYFCRSRMTNRDLLGILLTPSFSANYILSRKKFGSFGELLNRGFFGYLPTKDLRIAQTPTEEYIGLGVSPEYEIRGFEGARDQFLHTYFSAVRAAMKEPPLAKTVPLAEALKVRVITAGPPMTHFVLKPLQKFMWSVLKQHSTCELIGDPVDVDKVYRQIGRVRNGKFIVSGDYSDATNQLDPRLSTAAWETVCDVCCVPQALKQLGQRVLTDHWIHTTEAGVLPQQWGQLMGSIISFPILCIVNAAICRAAIEYDQNKVLTLDECGMMINGDDCLFQVGDEGYAAWNTFGKMAGLAPSVGKVYTSRSFCNVNSTTFTYHPEREVDENPYERVKVIRLGLAFGLKRSLAEGERENISTSILGNGTEWDSSLGARHRALMSECPGWCKVAVHKSFLRHNDDLLKVATEFMMPWYVPECFGGIGLEPIGDFGPSQLDRLVVTAMLNKDNLDFPRPPPETTVWKGVSKTKIHQVALQQLRRALGEVPSKWVSETSHEVDGLDSPSLSSWVIYQRPSDVINGESEAQTAQACLSQNRRVWSYYLRHARIFGWMTARTVLPRMKLIHDIRIKEKRPALLPTPVEENWRQFDTDCGFYQFDRLPRILEATFPAIADTPDYNRPYLSEVDSQGQWLSLL